MDAPAEGSKPGLGKRLATALWEGAPGALDPVFAEDFSRAGSDDERRRVVVDQVAGLTDQFAIGWHERLVGEVDASSVGIWTPRAPLPAVALPGGD